MQRARTLHGGEAGHRPKRCRGRCLRRRGDDRRDVGGPVSGEKLVDGLDQGRGCRGSRGCRGLGACCVCGVRFLEEVGVVISSGDRGGAVGFRGVRELGLVGVDGRKGNSIVAEQLLLRLCWRCGLELRGRVQLQLLSPDLVQLALLLLVLQLLLL